MITVWHDPENWHSGLLPPLFVLLSVCLLCPPPFFITSVGRSFYPIGCLFCHPNAFLPKSDSFCQLYQAFRCRAWRDPTLRVRPLRFKLKAWRCYARSSPCMWTMSSFWLNALNLTFEICLWFCVGYQFDLAVSLCCRHKPEVRHYTLRLISELSAEHSTENQFTESWNLLKTFSSSLRMHSVSSYLGPVYPAQYFTLNTALLLRFGLSVIRQWRAVVSGWNLLKLAEQSRPE